MSERFNKRKIVTVGTSFAVVIPKQVCRLLRLDRTTEVSLSLQDETIMIRAIRRADRSRQPDRFRLGKMLAILIQHYRMSVVEFDRLSHDGTSLKRLLADIDVGGYVDPVTVARLDECLGRRRDLERTKTSESWPETVDTVLLKIPNEPATTKD